jgi:threonine dehydratase
VGRLARGCTDEVEVVLQVETRGPRNCEEVIGALRAAGYTLAFG